MPGDYPVLRLRSGREYSILNGHPWVFSGAFRELPTTAPPGSVADVVNSRGEWIARGYLNAANSLAFRVLTREHSEEIDRDFYIRRVRAAAELRQLLPPDVTGYRLVHAEADYLPGLIVDHFDRWLVAQFHIAGAEAHRELILGALDAALTPDGILVRDDIRMREREGLPTGTATAARGEVPQTIEMREGAVRYVVDPWGGQKTGFFLDQRDKRASVAALSPHARTLLNCFAYSGGFALSGLSQNPGLATVNVDSSAIALDLARQNYQLNGVDPEQHSFVVSDAVRYLQSAHRENQRFDIVVVDPPAFAKTLAMKQRALRGYESLNAQAAQVVASGGQLLTCSCSGGVEPAEFEAAVSAGLLRAQRSAQIVANFGPSLDHPTLPGFPEDRYLKALLLRLA